MKIPAKGGYRPLLFSDTKFRNDGARCDEHCRHFKDKSCWLAISPQANYKIAEMCSDYKPIFEEQND